MAYTANIIPAMTSATAPSGVVTSSGSYDAGTIDWLVFDHSGSTRWYAVAGTTGWIQYQFSVAHIVTQYAVTTAFDVPVAPKTWTFQGSNNGTDWTTLDTQTNVTDWAALTSERKVFGITNSTAYAYYRLDITASNDAEYAGVGELEMMETARFPVIGSPIVQGMRV